MLVSSQAGQLLIYDSIFSLFHRQIWRWLASASPPGRSADPLVLQGLAFGVQSTPGAVLSWFWGRYLWIERLGTLPLLDRGFLPDSTPKYLGFCGQPWNFARSNPAQEFDGKRTVKKKTREKRRQSPREWQVTLKLTKNTFVVGSVCYCWLALGCLQVERLGVSKAEAGAFHNASEMGLQRPPLGVDENRCAKRTSSRF